ncbi:hypothetical protein [Clostridium rectalis]|uniref:hypothetical protein n=1 Tax=Clostridium rectalis TaxID=2040295 RepID=UPI000F63BFD9|nr:hypothetical protein [Clostridium rectalis]
MKKLVALIFLCFGFLITFKYYTGAYLTPNDFDNKVKTKLEVFQLTEENYFKELSNSNNISVDKLKDKIGEIKNRYEKEIRKDGEIIIKNRKYEYKKIRFVDVLVSNKDSNCKVVSECLAVVFKSGLYKEIIYVDGARVSIEGEKGLSWEKGDIRCRTINNNTSIFISGTGYVQGDIFSKFCKQYKNSGFSIEESKWKNCKVSKFYILQHTYNLLSDF